MIQVDLSWLLVLPLLFVLGWFTARLDLRQARSRRAVNLSSLVKAVQALASGRLPQAVPPLLEAAKESPEILGIQRALADLFRRQGEPDRAIDVRLSLLARGSLAASLEQELLFELAQDYLAAGILDRAEACLVSLREGPLSSQAAGLEVFMFQQQRRWREALQALDRSPPGPDVSRQRFHFCMELGDRERATALFPDHPRLGHPKGLYTGQHLCKACGFRTEQHYWQCPGCMAWDSLSPLQGNAQRSTEAQAKPASIA